MNGVSPRDRLIVALDANESEALRIAESLKETVTWVKVGMTLFYEVGPRIVDRLTAMGFDVFLDLKLHDIPHQVAGAARSVGSLGARMLTVHAAGGSAMVSAAVEGARRGAIVAGIEPPAVLAVTVLTSMGDEDLAAIGVTRSASDQVPMLARLARDAGADGVVCSPMEARAMRELLGDTALVVTPGVRPEWADAGDQARIATPSETVRLGASHLVVGRPITSAESPATAAQRIVAELEGAGL